MRIHIFTYDPNNFNTTAIKETIDNISSVHETQNSIIFISDLKATKVVDKADIDSVVLSGLR
jgi:hypothetical protein